MKRIALISVLLFGAAGYAQDNSCAYTFTYTGSQFSFCVTVWGTLASIQSPIGVNHLDPANPVEGWTAYITDDGGGQDGGPFIPGLNAVSSTAPPTVRQPNGPGKLPLIFEYGSKNYTEVISATPGKREIHILLRIAACNDCYWSGTVSRVANIRADGNSTSNFAHSAFASFGYMNHGVMLSVDPPACAGADPNGASTSAYFSCSVSSAPFNGPGALFTSWVFSSARGKGMSMKATYRVF